MLVILILISVNVTQFLHCILVSIYKPILPLFNLLIIQHLVHLRSENKAVKFVHEK